MTMPFDTIGWLDSPTGARLALRRHMPARKTVRAIVAIQHGLAEHSARYRDFATFMAARGYAVYAHDHRGHGQTSAPDAALGQFARSAGAALVIADSLAVIDRARSDHGDAPVFVFGHSMGGFIAMNVAIDTPARLAGLAVWNADFSDPLSGRLAGLLLAIERLRRGSDVPSRWLPAVTFAAWARAVRDRHSAFDWLTHERAVVDAYIADPLCGFLPSVSMWRDILDLMARGRDPTLIHRLPKELPIHLVGGGQDPATSGGKAVERHARRLRRLGLVDVTGRIYGGLRHESLNETLGREVMGDFCAWTERVLTVEAPHTAGSRSGRSSRSQGV